MAAVLRAEGQVLMLYRAVLSRVGRRPFPVGTGGGGPRRPRRGAFTLVELLVVVGIIAVLLGILMTAVSKARSSASSVACLSNLRQMHHAFLLYASYHGGRYPNPMESQISWEQAVAPYLGGGASGVLRCPSDEEIYPAVGSSYDWRDTGVAATTLAGDGVGGARNDAIPAFETLPGWHAKRMMNAVRTDGSAQPLEAAECLADLQKPVARH